MTFSKPSGHASRAVSSNPAQAMSRTQRDAANHWFDHTLATRLNDKINGRMLLVMQRLHADDLSGHLLEKGGWEHLCLPAKAEADVLIDMGDYRHLMEAGALLQPLRETEAVLEQLRLDLGSMAYSAQYLQAPVAESGNLIHRDWLHEAASPARESCEMLIQSWDTAIKTGAAHDYSACATIAVRGQHYYVLDMVAVKQDYPTLKRTIISHYQDYQPDAVLIEDKASGQSLLQDLRGESSMPLIAIMPKGDKLYRAARMTPLLEAGLVSFPYHAAWKDACMSELVQFPNGAHDDQVDALMQGLHWLHKKSGAAEFVRTL